MNPNAVQTNMVFVEIGKNAHALADYLETRGILIDRAENLRMVTHLDITKEDIHKTVQAFGSFYAGIR